MFARVLALAAVCLAGGNALATDFGPLMDVARETWPTKTRITVVGNYDYSQEEIQALADAAGPDYRIIVLDVASESTTIPRLVASLTHPDYVVLLRNDHVYREGGVFSTWMVRQLAQKGIPTVGTTSTALAQGAVFAVGPETGNEVRVNPDVKDTIHVVLPQQTPVHVSRLRPGRARVQRVGLGGL